MEPAPPRLTLLRFAAFAVLASWLYGVCDLVFSWNPLAAAPYEWHRAEPVFRAVPALVFGTFAEGVNGFIAAAAFAAVFRRVPGSPWRQGLALGLTAWAFWVVSGTMSTAVWLNVPWSLAAANVAFGFPKCLCIGWGVAWIARRLDVGSVAEPSALDHSPPVPDQATGPLEH